MCSMSNLDNIYEIIGKGEGLTNRCIVGGGGGDSQPQPSVSLTQIGQILLRKLRTYIYVNLKRSQGFKREL